MTFEQDLEKLSEIVKELEKGDLPLDKALDRYKEGIGLAVEAKKLLKDARLTVKYMDEDKDNDGE